MSRDRPSAEEAFADYLVMGPDRSIAKLCEKYAGTCAKPPSLRTLKSWSAEGSWRHRVIEHEVQVSATIQSLAIEGTAQGHLDMAAELHHAARRLVAKVLSMVDSFEAGGVADAEKLVDIALKLSKHALDTERGQPPSQERLREVLKSMAGDKEDDTVTTLPSRAEPRNRDSILKQFEAITGHKHDGPN